MSADKNLTLVLGATGKTGRRVVQRLQERGQAVRIGSRATTPAFDWEQPHTWPAVLDGATAMYVTYYPDVAIPGALDTVQAFIDAAEQSTVKRIVFLSGRGEEEAQKAEQAVKASSLQWTILRCSWFAQNFDENFLIDSVRAGEVVLPAGDIGEPFIDVDDIADVALEALMDDRHIGHLYELTGPRLLTFKEAVAEIEDAMARPLRYVQVTREQYAAAMDHADLPQGFKWLLDYLFHAVLDGRNSFVTSDVERVLGRPARDFKDYANAAAASGAWD